MDALVNVTAVDYEHLVSKLQEVREAGQLHLGEPPGAQMGQFRQGWPAAPG